MSASSGRARHLNTPPRARRQLDESKHSAKTTELLSSQGLGKNICYLLLCTDVNQVDVARQDLLSNKNGNEPQFAWFEHEKLGSWLTICY